MNPVSILDVKKKLLIALLLGVCSFILAPYGIAITIDTVKIDIPWSLIFPFIITMAFGWQYGILSGLCGGALFPFLLWPEDGWVNVSTTVMYVLLYALVGLANGDTYATRLNSRILRIALAVGIYILLNFFYDVYLFSFILQYNPPFWKPDAVTSIDQNIIYSFAFKDGINVIAVTLATETLLRLPVMRKALGLPLLASMHANHLIFGITLLVPILVWLTFLSLGLVLLRAHNALLYEHKSFALLVILVNGFLASRILFYYSETRFTIQHKLRDSESRYRTVFENITDVLYQTDMNGLIIEMSPSITALSGYTRDELIGTHLNALVEIHADPQFEQLYSQESSDLKDRELKLKTKHGEIKYVSINTCLIFGTTISPVYVGGIMRDVSERKRNEKLIADKNRILQLQNKELEQFAYITSHDLQEPLQTLTSISTMLKDEYAGTLDEQADIYLDFITSSSLRMKTLVKGLLDYSRIGKNSTLTLTNTNTLVKEIVDELTGTVQGHSSVVTIEDLPELHAYPMELKLAFHSFLSNALKFQAKNQTPSIKIFARQETQHWVFAVQDNGIGLETKDFEKIFIIFKRLHNRSAYPGAGIGLSHCKKIVELHGGSIWVDSILGEGSTFYFTIPTGL
jgi:PAS domain S-box-containing protein